jgi:molybdopterin/thiamine biosynthesis adenylyltransferase
MALSEAQIRRYSRHILLPDVGGTGQSRLLAATVSIDLATDTPAAIAAATYLAAAGIGTLVLTGGSGAVSETDLRTGIALGARDLGRPLFDAVADRLRAINPDVRITDTPGGTAIALSEGCNTPLADALVRGGRAAVKVIREILA